MEKIKSIKEDFKIFIKGIQKHNISEYAAQCAYYIILSFIPFIILLLTLIQYLGIDKQNLYFIFQTLIPENIHNPFEKKLNDKNTEEISIKTDFVVFATGAEENDELYEKLKNNKKIQVYNVGDSKKLASAWEAINDANEIARGIRVSHGVYGFSLSLFTSNKVSFSLNSNTLLEV